MKRSTIITVLLATALARAGTGTAPVTVFESPGDPTPAGSIDESVFRRLKKLGIQPARVCSDAVFVRRVFLDVIGTLPTSDEVTQFLNSPNANKRRALIDRLLKREEFAVYWAMKWNAAEARSRLEFGAN